MAITLHIGTEIIKYLFILSILLFSNFALAQKSPCELISDMQLSEMQISRDDLFIVKLLTNKDAYATEVDMSRIDCRYKLQAGKNVPEAVLVSFSKVNSGNDEEIVLVSVHKMLTALQSSLGAPPWLNYSLWEITRGWCSKSSSGFSPPMAGCSGIRNGLLVYLHYENRDGKNFDVQKKLNIYFDELSKNIGIHRESFQF